MIDHLLGRPSPSWKRLQVFLVIAFWSWHIARGKSGGPRLFWLRRANRALQRFTPWQIIVSTLTAVYAFRHLDRIIGLGSPEPLASLYSRSYYRATWISTGLDAGFATAMSIRPKWLRDFCSVIFSVYYIIYANEADEKLRKFRAVCTVEMLRTTWEKTTNPYIWAVTYFERPRLHLKRKVLLARPTDSAYKRPITAWLYFGGHGDQLARATDLILDFPGGGFVAMTPEHHEERLRLWAARTRKPVLSVEYGKAPEYPYPFAIDECYDTYRVLSESVGRIIGMSGKKLNIIMSGDSAGANIAVNVMIKLLESQTRLSHPKALVLSYPCLDFNFTSWMSPANLRVLRSEQSSGNIGGLAEQKDHLGHISPLSMTGDRKVRRRRTWSKALTLGASLKLGSPAQQEVPRKASLPRSKTGPYRNFRDQHDEDGSIADEEDETDVQWLNERDKPISARVLIPSPTESELEKQKQEISQAVADAHVKPAGREPIGTRLTMTSRTGYFQDRIISPSLMRAMAILYIGPRRNPDFEHDYYISPILTPAHLLAQFPPILMQCGEKDPFVDDTVIFAGRVREAKRARKVELDKVLAGDSAKFGEALRMSTSDADNALKQESDRLSRQGDDDWVQMQIFSDWSHGYLQMPSLMREARAAINDIADWISEVFNSRDQMHSHDTARVTTLVGARNSEGEPSSSHKGRAAQRSEYFGSPLASETETDSDAIMFMPKKRSPTRMPNGTGERSKRRAMSSGGSPSQSSGSDCTLRDDIATMDNRALRMGEISKMPICSTPAGILDVITVPPAVPANVPVREGTGPKAGTPTNANLLITETELMRRRRLLDSHIFEYQ